VTANSFAVDRFLIGWHGKLPTVGDFVTRRLDTEFVSNWDNWISRGLTDLRSHSGNRWVDDYLRSPTWRFLLTPGFLPPPLHAETWVGVVMPSVDRVGRYYPLTLASPLTAVPDSSEGRTALWEWLQSLEDLAIDALEGDWSIEALEGKLLSLGLPPNPAGAIVKKGNGLYGSLWPMEGVESKSMESFFGASSMGAKTSDKQGCCVWYGRADAADPRILLTLSLEDSLAPLWCDELAGDVNGV
jgi:type VI secretion system protein ImpM